MLGFLSSKPDHPLADPKAARKIVSGLPPLDALKALDELTGWVDSVCRAEGFKPLARFETIGLLDEAAQPRARKLVREYLASARMPRSEELKLWNRCSQFWNELALAYETCLLTYQDKQRGGNELKPKLSLLLVRLVSALANAIKWADFRYGPVGADLWPRLGKAYAAAVAAGCDRAMVQPYPQSVEFTCATDEYLRALVFAASSVDSLLPMEIEIAERLVAHFLPAFELSAVGSPGAFYWVDFAGDGLPRRLAVSPAPSASLRFIVPKGVQAEIGTLAERIAKQGVPADVNLGGQYSAHSLHHVLEHLALYWAPEPPQRKYPRHGVKNRLAVIEGFDHIVATVEAGQPPPEADLESWVTDDVSQGGMRAQVPPRQGDRLRIGSLLGIQPEGGDNWILAAVRRMSHAANESTSLGLESLSKKVVVIVPDGVHGPMIWLMDGNPEGETRLVALPGQVDQGESLSFRHEGRRLLLTPLGVVEGGVDYEIGRYRERYAEG